MAFCPQCGAPTNPAMSFCTACGRTLDPAPSAATPGASTPATPGADPTRPVGKRVEPWVVPVLYIVTFSIYGLFFWWRVSREVDAHTGSRSHPLVRAGVLVSLLGLVLTAFAVGTAMAEMMGQILADPEATPDEEAFVERYARGPMALASGAIGLVGAGLLYSGLARTWGALRVREAETGRPDPVNAPLFVRFAIGLVAIQAVNLVLLVAAPTLILESTVSSFVSFLSFALTVALIIVAYSTQKHLNALWQATQAGWTR